MDIWAFGVICFLLVTRVLPCCNLKIDENWSYLKDPLYNCKMEKKYDIFWDILKE